MRKVFISYSRIDFAPVVALVEALRARGLSVWLDQSSIPASVPWQDEVTQAIRSASLVVIFSSENWHASASCALEGRIAFEHATPVEYVADDRPLEASVEQVLSRLSEIIGSVDAEAELLGASHRWLIAGRPRSTLPAGQRLRSFSALRVGGGRVSTDATVGDFIDAGRRLRRRRSLVAAGGVALLTVLFLVPTTLQESSEAVAARVVENRNRLDVEVATSRAVTYDGYDGLAAALHNTSPTSKNSFSRHILTAAMNSGLPSSYGVATEPPAPVITARNGTVIDLGDPDRVRVVRDGNVNREFVVGGAVAAATDRNGYRLAVAARREILVFDIRYGTEVARLRGVGPVTALEWVETSGQPDHLRGWTADGHLATWLLDPSVRVGADESWWFMDTAVDEDGTVGAITRSGDVVVIKAAKAGKTDVRVKGRAPAPALSITATPRGWAVGVASGPNTAGIAFIDGSGKQQLVPLPECVPVDSSWSEVRESLYVACGVGEPAYEIDLATMDVRAHPTSLMEVSTVASRGAEVVLGGGPTEFLSISEAGEQSVVRFGYPPCWHGALRSVINPESTRMFYVGAGVDTLCGKRFTIGERVDPSKPEESHLMLPVDIGNESRALALGASANLLAVGGSNGTILVIDPDDLGVPLAIFHATGSEIRGLEFTDGDQSLIAVTLDGEVHRVPLDEALMSYGEARASASALLEAGKKWGIAPTSRPR